MTAKKRILALRLSGRLKANPQLADKLGVQVNLEKKVKENKKKY